MNINPKNDIFLSVLLHGGFLAFLILCSVAFSQNYDDLTYVEVSFGLNENLVQTQKADAPSQPEGEQLASKAKDALPQLTKDSAPKISQSEQKIDTEDTFKDQEKTPIKENNNVKKKPENINMEAKQDANLDMKDFLKRKEESLRKTADKTQVGQKAVDSKTKPGIKHSLAEIPSSPFDTVTIPNAPISTAPTGVETGTNLQTLDTYKTYLRSQLKLHWKVPDILNFSPTLVTVISFTIGEFGDLIGAPQITQSSANIAFDKLVIEAVMSTFPVATPPPKEIHPPQTFFAKYNSKDVR